MVSPVQMISTTVDSPSALSPLKSKVDKIVDGVFGGVFGIGIVAYAIPFFEGCRDYVRARQLPAENPLKNKKIVAAQAKCAMQGVSLSGIIGYAVHWADFAQWVKLGKGASYALGIGYVATFIESSVGSVKAIRQLQHPLLNPHHMTRQEKIGKRVALFELIARISSLAWTIFAGISLIIGASFLPSIQNALLLGWGVFWIAGFCYKKVTSAQTHALTSP